MARLRDEFLERVDAFADRVLDVVEACRGSVPLFVCDQLARSGTSVGANIAEASEAMSRPDFIKTLSVALKELAETKYWLRMIARRGWLPPRRLIDLQDEADELRKILSTMIIRSREKS